MNFPEINDTLVHGTPYPMSDHERGPGKPNRWQGKDPRWPPKTAPLMAGQTALRQDNQIMTLAG